jgi:glutamate synthase (NADPH/NADH) large chain
VLHEPESAFMNQDLYNSSKQDHGLDKALDQQLIVMSREALDSKKPVRFSTTIANVNRTVGTMLGHEVTKAYGGQGLPDGTIDITFEGSAGNSFGAFLPNGITLRLEGDSNDYVGKGLSGGTIVIRPDRASLFPAERNVIAGNVIGYGATQGSMFIRGIVGERFLVRNSGATAVVEGVGDHALEYMTGGLAVILGSTGRNLGAGMSGGTAYVHRLRSERVNPDSLASGELELLPLGSADVEIVRDLLVQHQAETGSTVAGRMLENFDDTIREFVKVYPRDYGAVLATRQSAVDAGIDPDSDAVWEQILEVTGG